VAQRKGDDETYHLVLRPEGDGPPGIHRLRAFLKCALRQYRLRCTSARYGPCGESDMMQEESLREEESR
jgi:hypothetical protein